MEIPSREALIAEVDDEFRRQHRDAPETLNPDDPAQAHWVQAWRELYTQMLYLRVDRIFFSIYRHAPESLDPDDPSHAQLIEFWNDIRSRIEHGTSRWDWDGTVTPEDPVPDGSQLDQNQFARFIEDVLTGVVQLSDETELGAVMHRIDSAGRGPALQWFEAALGSSAEVYARGLADSTLDPYATTSTTLSSQAKEGSCYGLLWEVSGQPEPAKGFNGTTVDSAEHLREAFYTGVGNGRHLGALPVMRNQVLLMVGDRVARGDQIDAGYQWLINIIWHNMDPASRDLSWPVPADQTD